MQTLRIQTLLQKISQLQRMRHTIPALHCSHKPTINIFILHRIISTVTFLRRRSHSRTKFIGLSIILLTIFRQTSISCLLRKLRCQNLITNTVPQRSRTCSLILNNRTLHTILDTVMQNTRRSCLFNQRRTLPHELRTIPLTHSSLKPFKKFRTLKRIIHTIPFTHRCPGLLPKF